MKNLPSLKDTSLWVLILSNIISIIMALIHGWDMHQVLWVYWAQSVIIGIMNFKRIRGLKEFSTKNFKMSGNSVSATPEVKNQVAYFFAAHYGFFHVGYALFLWQSASLFDLKNIDLVVVALLIVGFGGAHRFSYKHNITRDFKQKKPNIGTLMFYPYLRIIPMHIVIVFGTIFGSSIALFIFMVLKTFADAGMHMIEHHMFRR